MQVRLQTELTRALPSVAWDVASAGVDARPGQSMCRYSGNDVVHLRGGREFVASHRSQALTRKLVDDAGLILLASEDERSAVAALSAEARRRTFTFLEAAAMMSRSLMSDRTALQVATSPDDVLRTVVDLLHEQRGTLAISAGPAHFSRRRHSRKGRALLDIGDVHQGQERRHKSVLRAIDLGARELAAGLARLQVLSTETAAPALLLRTVSDVGQLN